MHIGQQGRRVETALFRQRVVRLPAGGALGHTRVHHLANGFELNRRNNRADVDRLIERRTNPQGFHTGAKLDIERLGHTFLHQQPRARAAYLPLVEPDRVHQALHRGVEVGVVEDDEGRFSTQLERELLVRLRSGLADYAAHLGRTSESDLVDAGMLDERLANARVAGEHIEYAGRQARFRG